MAATSLKLNRLSYGGPAPPETTQGRRRGRVGADAQGETRGREQDFAEISRRMYAEIRSSRDPRDHVEDGASASPPSGGRPRLVADYTHKEPCTKIARAGTCSFIPISQ